MEVAVGEVGSWGSCCWGKLAVGEVAVGESCGGEVVLGILFLITECFHCA